MQTDQPELENSNRLVSPREGTEPRLRLPRNVILSSWPYRDSLSPYGVTAALDWHGIASSGRWDITKIISDLKQFLRHSHRTVGIRSGNLVWDEAVFVLSQDLWFTVSASFGSERDLHVWATCHEKAEHELTRLKSVYMLPAKKSLDIDRFFVLMVSCHGMIARRVASPPFFFSERELELHYGEQFCRWNREFLTKLNMSKIGLSILQGSPGTGKTSYLRHLVHKLRDTHRFYYVPVTVYPMLAAPDTVDFWISENNNYGDKLKIVIIEDAETLLMQRGSDNHDSLSNLLNIADGFLGSFLKLHVICTVNTAIEKLDPAVMRPGRLLAQQTFNRLSPEQARILATAKGLNISLQESYSLAEIYNQNGETVPADSNRSAGFAKS